MRYLAELDHKKSTENFFSVLGLQKLAVKCCRITLWEPPNFSQ